LGQAILYRAFSIGVGFPHDDHGGGFGILEVRLDKDRLCACTKRQEHEGKGEVSFYMEEKMHQAGNQVLSNSFVKIAKL
jgi:hypothetical protein